MKGKNLPLVSIIVPSYNHEKYVKETIESIVNQTYENIELIVIDDGSKDNSPEILQKLSEKYSFSFIKRENQGLCRTLNEGIKLAKGEYVCLCASDDKLVLNKTESQVLFLTENPRFIMSYGNKINFYPNGMERKITNTKYKSGNIFDDLLLQNFHIPPVSAMYRKRVFDEVGLFDVELAVEDVDMFLRIAKKFEIGYQKEFFYYYRVHDANSIGNIKKMEENTEEILSKWKDEKLYDRAMFRKNLLYFRNYTASNKIEAIKRIPLDISIFSNRVFYEGMLRLLIPRWIIEKIKAF